MHVELINTTDYANIYCLYDEYNRPIGTKEVKLAGREAGVTFYYSLTSKTRKEIRRLFAEATNPV